mgnify:CR=1 FL=1
MEGNQKISCIVESCKYNNKSEGLCTLNSIIVTPTQRCNAKQSDESKCSSYKYEKY